MYRRELGETSVRRLAAMVTAHLRQRLPSGPDLPAEAAIALNREIESRLRQPENDGDDTIALSVGPDLEHHYAPLLERHRVLRDTAHLDEMVLTVALLTGHREDVVAGLSTLANLPVRAVLEIIASQSARAMCALAHAAGLSAHFAAELQIKLAGVARDAVLHPAPDGGYPLSDEEMAWHMDMFTPAAPATAAARK